MPVIIREIVDGRFRNHAEIASGSWDLRTQIESLEAWLSENADQLDSGCRWVADLGFTVRLDATGGGPPISCDLMKMCIAANLDIYLSEYGAASDDAAGDERSGGTA